MRRPRGLVAVGVAGTIFAVWQIVNHAVLMNMEMVSYHLTGFIVETALATAAILWAVHYRERAEAEREKRERLVAVVAAAIVSSDPDVSPVASLVRSLEAIRQHTEHLPAVQDELGTVQHCARRIEATRQGLQQILACEVEM